MSLLSSLRSPRLSFIQTLLSLLLSLVSLSSSYWCVGRQKVPKPLCSAARRLKCTPVHGVSDGSFSWETGDDRFIFPSFHAGLWTTCEENIFTDAWGEGSGVRGHVCAERWTVNRIFCGTSETLNMKNAECIKTASKDQTQQTASNIKQAGGLGIRTVFTR
ncbi:germ cell-specific gene 1 protein-like [Puntigrus tetrazona]|uniref:germ cell-specific gene 1 protein-like n=1 Tax=Puntigrus tetrazona TaxID=1606681 RepID=UPI001C8AF8FE|nr:germ cell-specific gene 1 protein-like [Puntigrus tetrazona]